MLFLTALKIKNETFKLPNVEGTQYDTDQETSNPYDDFSFFEDGVMFTKLPTQIKRQVPRNWIYPALLVQIGSGISFVKIDAEDYVRLDGSACGGATFMGLARLITGNDVLEFSDILDYAAHGMTNELTLTVGDIYGKSYNNLMDSLPAAFFGKVTEIN